MQIERKLILNNGSYYFPVSKDLLKHLELDPKTSKNGLIVHAQDDEGIHGKFISFWNPDAKPKKENK